MSNGYVSKKTEHYKAIVELKKQPRSRDNITNNHIFRVCYYLADLLETHHIAPPHSNVNLRDAALMEKHGITKWTAYSYLIDSAIKLNIITIRHNNYNPLTHECRIFDVNVDILQEIFDWSISIGSLYSTETVLSAVQYMAEKSHARYTPFESKPKYTNDELYDIIHTGKRVLAKYMDRIRGKVDTTVLENKFPKMVAKLRAADLTEIKEYKIRGGSKLTDDERWELSTILLDKYKNENNFIKDLYKRIEETNANLPEDEQFRLRITVKSKGNSFWPKGRLVNPIAYMHKENKISEKTGEIELGRNEKNAKDGYNANFDLHSEVPALIRAINTGKFNIDQDMKVELMRDLPTTEGYMKEKLFKYSWLHDPNRPYKGYVKDKGMRSVFGGCIDKAIDEWMQKWTGGTKRYKRSIWFYEAEMILYVVGKVRSKGCRIRNAYDCFYFNSDEISVKEVKDIITEAVFYVADQHKDMRVAA